MKMHRHAHGMALLAAGALTTVPPDRPGWRRLPEPRNPHPRVRPLRGARVNRARGR
ncbi:hypothetical protein ACFQS1_21940 [Paractinoplanes rhizophilus]|uniref:Uncharacterized protein n=1 Tax=Paractinoplanes rhizophilus TaxID=1416877 RepID=A0ABW2HVY7_9ACTN|nr:hypothetical protein [Actinoplanes sp.]